MTPERIGDWRHAVAKLLTMAHAIQSSEMATVVDRAVAEMGVEVAVYLVDFEQRALHAIPGKAAPVSLGIDSTLAGRAFASLRPVAALDGLVWVPIVNGTERLGVIEVRLPPPVELTDEVRAGSVLLAGAIGHLLTSKIFYGDTLHQVRRSQPMALSAEFLWPLLPPQTFATEQMVITATLEPAYAAGGDAYDYAVDNNIAYIAIFDAVGHGLPAAIATAVVLAATRAARRDGHGLYTMARYADEAIEQQFGDALFVTAVLAELNLDTGAFRYINAGHPRPLLMRDGRLVRTFSAGRRLPLGVDYAEIQVAEERLQVGDRLLFYTDGVVEARDAAGQLFGVDRLVDFAERGATAGLPPAETLRRLTHAVLDYQQGQLQDDASLLLVDWSSTASDRSNPR